MTKRRKQIPAGLKSKILAEALTPGCRVRDLAKTYGIAAWTIYTWLKAAPVKSGNTNTVSSNSKVTTNPVAIAEPFAKFMELSVEIAKDSHLDQALSRNAGCDNSNSSSSLQKASLTFKGFSCVLEGRIKSSTLLKVIKAIDDEVLL